MFTVGDPGHVDHHNQLEALSPQHVLNPVMFGAKGDGQADDSDAIRACIDAAVNSRGTGTGPARVNNTDRPDEYRSSGRFDLAGVEWVE